MTKAISMFSGGLDSVLASKLMLDQGIDLIGLNFITEFASSDIEAFKKSIRSFAGEIDLKIQFIDISADFLEMLKNPRYGYGKHFNPCIDCKILMLKKAKELMPSLGASFIITGEVLGERPMSQRRDALNAIENKSGLKGDLLRPLSAKLLPETKAEQSGLVDREKLMDIRGRGRKPQIALAKKYGIKGHFTPAGGCLLTDPGFTRRLEDLIGHEGLNIEDIKILKYGRHFRLGKAAKVIIGRDEKDNKNLKGCIKPSDVMINTHGFPGPLGVLRGDHGRDIIQKAAGILASYTKHKNDPEVLVNISFGDVKERLAVKPAVQSELDPCRI